MLHVASALSLKYRDLAINKAALALCRIICESEYIHSHRNYWMENHQSSSFGMYNYLYIFINLKEVVQKSWKGINPCKLRSYMSLYVEMEVWILHYVSVGRLIVPRGPGALGNQWNLPYGRMIFESGSRTGIWWYNLWYCGGVVCLGWSRFATTDIWGFIQMGGSSTRWLLLYYGSIWP